MLNIYSRLCLTHSCLIFFSCWNLYIYSHDYQYPVEESDSEDSDDEFELDDWDFEEVSKQFGNVDHIEIHRPL